jgi:anaerobic ribonucleoside-triphosphate reductase activating protein
MSRDKLVDELGEWILSCRKVEGVTFSGGEPFQQAPELRLLCEYLKVRQPSLSIGVFSGYTLPELAQGQWCWKQPDTNAWVKGDSNLFEQIKQFLDFGVFGRFRQTMACNDRPLCGSRNQEVVFLTNRYSQRDLEPQAYEVNISEDGAVVTITGFPPVEPIGTKQDLRGIR